MKTNVFLFSLYFWKCAFSTEIVTLPIEVTGKVISLEQKIVTLRENDLKEIKLTNIYSNDLFILGKADTNLFLYKIEQGITKTFKIKAKKINELFYILNNKKYKLEKYSDINYK